MATLTRPSAIRPGHWLVQMAQRLGWAQADTCPVTAQDAVATVWDRLATHCGVSDDQILKAVSASAKLPLAAWTQAEARAAKLIPERMARRHHVYPLHLTDRTLTVATSNPFDLEAEQMIAFSSSRTPVFVLATPAAIAAAIDAGYRSAGDHVAALLGRASHENDVYLAETQAPETIREEDVAATPVVSLANRILVDAAAQRASDIHVEPGRLQGVVRFRIDGVMRDYLTLGMPVFNRVVSRLKVMGGLDISDRMRPQDGRARVTMTDGHTLDLRLSTVPTRDSEKAVIRLLDTTEALALSEVGLPAPELTRMQRLMAYRDGVVLVTGPTGSGKTTTLYGAIKTLADGEVNITTIEDPVEHEMPGITQIQIEPKRQVTFASALRAVLRQDPDIVFVGEIRDSETATTAVQAALTGHLVLSTLHTNDAVGVIARLADLGLDRATIGTAVRGVVAQRLLRRLCACAVPTGGLLTADEVNLVALTGTVPTRRKAGCATCGETGYYGRFPVAEVLLVTPALAGHIASNAPVATLLQQATADGMRTMSQVALEAVACGDTTFEEVERVVGLPAKVGTPARLRAFLADDDAVMRTLVTHLLEKEGFDVTALTDGADVIQAIEDGVVPDFVVLDLNMPILDGRSTLRALRAHPLTRTLPALILTAEEDEALEAALLDEGADDYLRKPVDQARFLARVRAVLRRARPDARVG